MADDLGEKTEDPTPRRKEEARNQGNVPRSQDFGSVVSLLVATLMLWIVADTMLFQGGALLGQVLTDDLVSSTVTTDGLWPLIPYIGVRAVQILVPLLAVIWIAGVLSQLIQIGPLFAPQAIKPSLSKLSPMAGLKKLFSMRSLIKACFDAGKVVVVLAIVYASVREYAPRIVLLPYLTALQCVAEVARLMLDLTLRILAALVALGILDLMFQRWRHQRDLRMSKQEVKDEMKQADGDPQVKQRRARMAQEVAMQRIGAAVPRADVIVTNPEHLAIAIKYDPESMAAPRVIAKGADLLAMRIRHIAAIHGIPIVERKPLARALYRMVEAGQEIPPQFYKAVAEILAYVYRLNERRAG